METTLNVEPVEVNQLEVMSALVRRVFRIDDVTTGTDKQPFIVRYRGRLTMEDSQAAYRQLSDALKPYGLTPLFRWEGDQHVIFLAPGIPKPTSANPYVNLLLFVLTLLSVLFTGAIYGLEGPIPADTGEAIRLMLSRGWPFAVSMLGILGAHEFGHYLAGRYHGVHVTLPYFIPMPFSPFGTMGAFINMKEPPPNRRVLADIGIAGPLAGFVVAVPVLLIGLSLSNLDSLPSIGAAAAAGISLEGNSLVYLLSKLVVFGQMLPAPVDYDGVAPVIYWLRFILTARPFPAGGLDVMLHPVAWAGWAGLLVTGLNLIPAGQLDGGHILYVLFGRRTAQRVLPFVLVGLVALGFVWSVWWFWALIIFFLGRVHAEPLNAITPLDNRRKILAIAALVLFVLTFTPVPLSLY